ncbi:citrate lyase holo-[acyl-carrier protein] synthase [uncultured Ilyobacter sp.]|uniref:citrate lyase holo-[acyl-carrier protein] synthase n=1 Tax=uncultured Ilyobacter sp. TaxID=544433 RepID=UPI0029C89EAC|nr:citrate lyase holo-[acyl-carrier protein] synthase [uncultured Ilyobacter sp.]
MNKKTINPIDILNAREERVRYQKILSEKYELPFIALRANYPGLDKNNSVANDIASIMNKECYKIFKGKIRHTESIDSFEGIVYILFIEENPVTIKKSAVELEETHSLGRLVDIDVYRQASESISRLQLNLPKRKCFICEEDAHVCVRSRAHSLNVILDYIQKFYDNFKKN